MDEENYPLVLPNGNAYSREAMEDMALHQDGKVICPRTNEEFLFSQLRRAFIM
jgi:macrophage erythroblast attacher